jgi:hypothetical protein
MAPMANDVVELLRSCKAWVDPNLVALVPGGIKQNDGESKRKRRKRGDGNKSEEKAETVDTNTSPLKKKKPDDGNDKQVMEDSDDEFPDEFPDLAPNRIVLKRASHVAVDSDSEDNGSS